MPSTYTGSSFELLFRTAELAKFSKEEQKMIDAAQKAKWDAYAIQSYREQEDARIREEKARIRSENARLQEERSRLREEQSQLQNEQSRLTAEKSSLQNEQSRLREEQTRLQEEQSCLQEEQSRLHEEKLQLAKLLKASGVPLDEIAARIHLSKEDLKTL